MSAKKCFWCEDELSEIPEVHPVSVNKRIHLVCNRCKDDQLRRGIEKFLEDNPTWLEILDRENKELVTG